MNDYCDCCCKITAAKPEVCFSLCLGISYGYVSVSLLHLSLSAFAVFQVDRQFYVVDIPLLQWVCNAVFSDGPALDLEIVQHVMRRNIFVQKQLHI